MPLNVSVFSIKTLFFWCVFIPAVLAGENAPEGSLVLDISNVSSGQGSLRIALYQSSGGAGWNAQPFRVAEINSVTVGKVANYTFELLPFSDYAIKLFHDVNGNKNLDLSESGLPLEPFAFSTGSGQKKQSLLFKDAIIHFGVDDQHLLLNLISIKQN